MPLTFWECSVVSATPPTTISTGMDVLCTAYAMGPGATTPYLELPKSKLKLLQRVGPFAALISGVTIHTSA